MLAAVEQLAYLKKIVAALQEHAEYDEKRCMAFVCDPTSEPLPAEIPDGQVDAVLLIFVLSAIAPEKMATVLQKAYQVRPLVLLG